MATVINLGANGGGTGGAVDSVNGQTGTVDLTAADVGAAAAADLTAEVNRATAAEAAKYEKPAGGIPISDLVADSVVTSVAGQTGAVVLDAGDVTGVALDSDLTAEVSRAKAAESGLYTKPAGGVPLTDVAFTPVLAVNALTPDETGNVTITATGGGANITSSDSSVLVSGTATDPVLEVNPAKVVKKVNGVLPSSSGAVTISATVTGLVVAGDTVFDDGATDNGPYWMSLINDITGPTTIIIPSNAKKAGVAPRTLNIPDHVAFIGSGRRWGKTSYGADSGGTSICVADGYPSGGHNDGSLDWLFKAGHSSQIKNMSIIAKTTTGSHNLYGPVVWIVGGGGKYDEIDIDTGIGPAIFSDQWGAGFPDHPDSIDCSFNDLHIVGAANHSKYYIRQCTSTTSNTQTFTVDDATDIAPGMAVINLSNVGALDIGVVVTQVSGSTVTLYGTGGTGHAITADMSNDTLLFVSSPLAVLNDSDHMFVGCRFLGGTVIAAGADTQWSCCHFSGGSSNHIHNIITMGTQSQTFGTCTLDNANSATDAHILKVNGSLKIDGRVQSGIAAGGTPMAFIQDIGSDSQHGLFVHSMDVEQTAANGIGIDALICYSGALYDSTSGTYKKVSGRNSKPNPHDVLGTISFNRNGYNRTDAKGNPILCTAAGTSTGAPSAAASADFAGVVGLVTYNDANSNYTHIAPGSPSRSLLRYVPAQFPIKTDAGWAGLQMQGLGSDVDVPRTVTDGVTSTDTKLVSASATFTSYDVGAAVSGAGIAANTTIVSITNSTTVVLSKATTASATGVSVTITRPAQPTKFTPARICSAEVRMVFEMGIGTSAQNCTVSGRYGTGTAPAYGADATGSQFTVTNAIVHPSGFGTGQAQVIIEGFIDFAAADVGVEHWVDIAWQSATAADIGTMNLVRPITVEYVLSN